MPAAHAGPPSIGNVCFWAVTGMGTRVMTGAQSATAAAPAMVMATGIMDMDITVAAAGATSACQEFIWISAAAANQKRLTKNPSGIASRRAFYMNDRQRRNRTAHFVNLVRNEMAGGCGSAQPPELKAYFFSLAALHSQTHSAFLHSEQMPVS